MTTRVRTRLLALGALWGLVLAAVPALLMTDPYRLGIARRRARVRCFEWLRGHAGGRTVGGEEGCPVRGHRTFGLSGRAFQGLVGGAFAALLFWALMALTISGFTLRNPVEVSVLMSPGVFVGSFFVALPAFAYAFVGGLLLGPIFRALVNRAVGKEDVVVR